MDSAWVQPVGGAINSSGMRSSTGGGSLRPGPDASTSTRRKNLAISGPGGTHRPGQTLATQEPPGEQMTASQQHLAAETAS